MSIALVSGVSAQRHGGFGGGYRPVTRVYVAPSYSLGFGYGYGLGLGFGYGYPYFGYPFYGMYPYPYGGSYASRQSNLDRQIEQIKSDYADKIYSARNATDLNGKERRAEVKRLKQERDDAVNNLRNNYYKTPARNYNNQNNQNYNNNNLNNNNPSTNNAAPKTQE